MFRVLGLSVLLVTMACVHGLKEIILPGDRFPTCAEALEFFGNEGINLYSNESEESMLMIASPTRAGITPTLRRVVHLLLF